MTISLNGIVPGDTGRFCLSITILKSFLLSRSRQFRIVSNVYFCEEPVDSIVSKIIDRDVKVIAFSAYIWNMEMIKQVAKGIKEKKQDAYIIVGGPEVYFDTPKTLEENEIIDNPTTYNFRVEDQEYELNFDELNDTEYFYYETSRGCPQSCRYCGWSGRPTRKIREYPMSKIKRDLEQIFRLPKIKIMVMADSNLLMKKKRALAIFKLFNELNAGRARNGLNTICFHLPTRFEDLDDELLKEMVRFPNHPPTISRFGCTRNDCRYSTAY